MQIPVADIIAIREGAQHNVLYCRNCLLYLQIPLHFSWWDESRCYETALPPPTPPPTPDVARESTVTLFWNPFPAGEGGGGGEKFENIIKKHCMGKIAHI